MIKFFLLWSVNYNYNEVSKIVSELSVPELKCAMIGGIFIYLSVTVRISVISIQFYLKFQHTVVPHV